MVPARELPPCPAEQMPGPCFAPVRIPATNKGDRVLNSSVRFDHDFCLTPSCSGQRRRTGRTITEPPHVLVRNDHRA